MKNTRIFAAIVLLVTTAAAGMADDNTGLLISGIADDSPAEKAGLMRGDILIQIDGEDVDTPADVPAILSDYRAGQSVALTIVRGGNQRTVTVKLETRLYRPVLGVEFAASWGRGQMPWGTRPFGQPGAVVVEVAEGSPAADAGLQPRDAILSVDGEMLHGEELAEIIADHEPGDRVTLEISRPGPDGDEPFEVTVRLGTNDDGGAYLGIRYGHTGPMLRIHPNFRGRMDHMERRFNERLEDLREQGYGEGRFIVPGDPEPSNA